MKRPSLTLWVLLAVFFLNFVTLSSAFAQNGPPVTISFNEIDGSLHSLSEYYQKGPVYLTFWALWCDPCKQELRALKSFAKENEDKPFTILAVNQDSPKSLAKVKAYVRSQGYPFVIVLDPDAQVYQAFNGQNIPFSVLLDSSGKVVSARTGYLPGDEKEIKQEILNLLTK